MEGKGLKIWLDVCWWFSQKHCQATLLWDKGTSHAHHSEHLGPPSADLCVHPPWPSKIVLSRYSRNNFRGCYLSLAPPTKQRRIYRHVSLLYTSSLESGHQPNRHQANYCWITNYVRWPFYKFYNWRTKDSKLLWICAIRIILEVSVFQDGANSQTKRAIPSCPPGLHNFSEVHRLAKALKMGTKLITAA